MPPETRNELILPQYHYAYVQDETKGVVQVIVGPYKHGLTASDKPVIYDAQSRKFVPMPLDQAIAQNSNVPEDSYVVLENPAAAIPIVGPNSIVPLEAGRKVNLPGPRNFSLWPGQVSTVIAGHQMRSNEYIVVKVYNVEEATKNWPSSAIKMPDDLVVGTLLVIKGTEVSFFIPPTGLEVVKDPSGKYVRQAVTLEQLEYCILLDEQGEKTFSRGPQVVFPTATQQFVEKLQNSATAHGGTTERTTNVKFRAIELNDQMGIYCKVMAPYIGDDGWDDGVQHEVGEELFITGKQQRIYFPRAEQAIIEYAGINPDTGRTIQRQRYYAIAIPKGEARYVYDKNTGEVSTVKGPKAFLPDPRYQVIVNRVLDDIQCSIWYPGNEEALEYNRNLARTAAERNITTPSLAGTPLTQTASGAVDLDRTVNRQTRKTAQAGAMNIVADTLQRGTQYTPPPKLTLNTKYEGVPEIQVWTGYAVQVVDKSGGRRVVKGPSSILLEYDETLERLIFSTGNPKTMDKPYRTVYLRVDHNKVSDSIDVETRDMVRARIKVSYRIDFEGTKDEESAKWFAVENYVKFFTDHCRSLVAAAVKRLSVKELIDNSSQIVRDTVLGQKAEGKSRPGLFFPENNMRVQDVEVLNLAVTDKTVSDLIASFQTKSVQDSLTLTAKQQELEITTHITAINSRLQQLAADANIKKVELERIEAEANHAHSLALSNEKFLLAKAQRDSALVIEKAISLESQEKLTRRIAQDNQDLTLANAQTKLFVERMGSVNDKLANAIEDLSQSGMLATLSSAIAPIAVMEHQGIGPSIKRLLAGTPLQDKVEPMLSGVGGNGGHRTDSDE